MEDADPGSAARSSRLTRDWLCGDVRLDFISQSTIGDNSAACVEKSWRSSVKNGAAASERSLVEWAIGSN
jgi:hypothetical protein